MRYLLASPGSAIIAGLCVDSQNLHRGSSSGTGGGAPQALHQGRLVALAPPHFPHTPAAPRTPQQCTAYCLGSTTVTSNSADKFAADLIPPYPPPITSTVGLSFGMVGQQKGREFVVSRSFKSRGVTSSRGRQWNRKTNCGRVGVDLRRGGVGSRTQPSQGPGKCPGSAPIACQPACWVTVPICRPTLSIIASRNSGQHRLRQRAAVGDIALPRVQHHHKHLVHGCQLPARAALLAACSTAVHGQ